MPQLMLLAATLLSLLAGRVEPKPAPAPATDGVCLEVACDAVEQPIVDVEGDVVAHMWAFNYHAEGDADRPITFLWNGGPGASAALLHLGFGSPFTMFNSDGAADGVHSNPHALIDLTDLVYVDPVGTGFSRASGKADDEDFWSVTTDAEVAAAFVETFLAERDLLDRPIYLCGESYGAVRVGAMLEPLRTRGIVPEGLILISPALESRALNPPRGSSHARRARADRLPTIAALVAHHDGRSAEEIGRIVDEARTFALGPYLEALEMPDALTEEEIESLRAERDVFTDGRDIRHARSRDMLDARFKADKDIIGGIEIDSLGATLKSHLKDIFDIETGGRYALMNRQANSSWRTPDDAQSLGESDIRTTDMIAQAAERADPPRVFIAGGWYDLITPFTASYRLAEAGAFGAAPVTVRNYPSGHVIYAEPEAHEALMSDLRTWWGTP